MYRQTMRLEACLTVLENSHDDKLGSPFLARLKTLLSLGVSPVLLKNLIFS